MQKILIISMIFFLGGETSAQKKYDYTWIFGYDYTDDMAGSETTILDFNSVPISQRYVKGDMDLSSGPAYISDPETGRLMFYTNGCAIMDSTHQVMKNGHQLNLGVYWINFCQGDFAYYPITASMLILPDPSNKKGYYLMHKIFYGDSLVCKDLRYTYIDMEGNGGLGEVTEKNILVADDIDFSCGYVTAVKHANNKDWWIVLSHQTEQKYFVYLLDDTGIKLHHVEDIGIPLDLIGQASFTPDGTKYVAYDDGYGIVSMNFDRENGKLSAAKHTGTEKDSIKGGLAISPNSRFAYITLAKKILQVDLWEEDLSSGIETIAVADETIGTWFEQNFGSATLGPDCRIYVAPASGSRALHVIHHPNEKGKACDVRQQDLPLLYPRSNGYLHSYINYRIDEEEYCDPSITPVLPTNIREGVEVYPNPAQEEITISIRDNDQIETITMYNLSGQKVIAYEAIKTNNLSINHLEKGMYIIHIHTKQGDIRSGKFIKE